MAFVVLLPLTSAAQTSSSTSSAQTDSLGVPGLQGVGEPRDPSSLLLLVVREAAMDPARRLEAVRSLLKDGDPAVIEQLVSALAPGNDPAFQRVIAQALASREHPPPPIFAEPLLLLLTQAQEPVPVEVATALGRLNSPQVTAQLVALASDPAAGSVHRRAAIVALAFHRSQPAVECLMDLIDPHQSDPVRQAAFEALGELTGLAHYGSNIDQWQQWWRQSMSLSPQQWYAELADNIARRAGALARENLRVRERLVETHRQLHRATPQEGRQALLVNMLADSSAAIRQLAVELSVQRLVDQGPFGFGPDLVKALLAALEDPSPTIRQGSARLLRDLGDPAGAQVMVRRLISGQEQDREVLRVILRAVAETDHPVDEVIDRAMGFLSDPDLRNEAAGVLARAAHEGLFDEDQKNHLREQLRQQIPGSGPPLPKVIELLGYVGSEDDWKGIEGWIDSDDDAVKTAAARAWARSDRPLYLLAQRANVSVLQPIIIAAAAERGRNGQTLLALIEHRPDQDQIRQAWQRALVAMAGRVDPADVLHAYAILRTRNEPLELREQMLSAAITSAMPAEGSPLIDPLVLVDLLLHRADVRMADGKPRNALADLGLIAGRQWSLPADQAIRLSTLTMGARLAVGDVRGAMESAEKMLVEARGGNGDAFEQAGGRVVRLFLEAAQRSVDGNQPEQAQSILTQLRQIMGASLTGEQAGRVRQLEEQIRRIALPTPPAPAPVPDGNRAAASISGV